MRGRKRRPGVFSGGGGTERGRWSHFFLGRRHTAIQLKSRAESKSAEGSARGIWSCAFPRDAESPDMSDKILPRFLRYVQINTQSDEASNTFPSTTGQLVLLEMLKEELSDLGAADVQMTKHGYVMASVPANTRKASVPTVAFLAHVDTAPDCSGKDVKPILHPKYNGALIRFPDK